MCKKKFRNFYFLWKLLARFFSYNSSLKKNKSKSPVLGKKKTKKTMCSKNKMIDLDLDLDAVQ